MSCSNRPMCATAWCPPRLIHTRFGFHIIEVLGQRRGKLPEFGQVRERIQAQLVLQSRATALRQYMQLLVGRAHIEGGTGRLGLALVQ